MGTTPYGEELRERRQRAGLTQSQLAELAVISRSHLAHIEAGSRYPSEEDARRLDVALDTGGVFVRFLPRDVAQHFAAAARLETQATMIREYAATLVPGLLQTEAYARAVFRVNFPRLSEEQCAENIRTRVDRARKLDDPINPEVWALLDEAVLRRPIGGSAAMADQLKHLIELQERVRLHVIPFRVGAHALMEGSLVLMRFEDMAPVAYVEGVKTGSTIDDPATVEQADVSYDLALAEAMSQHDSRALIKAYAEEYRHAHHTRRSGTDRLAEVQLQRPQ